MCGKRGMINMKKIGKRGFADQITSIFIGLAVISIVAVVVFLILSQLKANTLVKADTNATAAVATVQTAASSTIGWLPIVITVVIGALLIALVIGYFRGKRQ
jgi:ABC-type cobalt transport system substrate-binding protein